jgi:hypothetical protein
VSQLRKNYVSKATTSKLPKACPFNFRVELHRLNGFIQTRVAKVTETGKYHISRGE